MFSWKIILASLLLAFAAANDESHEEGSAGSDNVELFSKMSLSGGVQGLKNLVKTTYHKYSHDDGSVNTDALKQKAGDLYYNYVQDMREGYKMLAEAAEKAKSGSFELYERIQVEDIKTSAGRYYSKALQGIQQGIAVAAPVVSKWANTGAEYAKRVADKAVKTGNKWYSEGLPSGADVLAKGREGLGVVRANAIPVGRKVLGKARDTFNYVSHEVMEHGLPAAQSAFDQARSGAVAMFAKVPVEQIQAYADTAKAEFEKLKQKMNTRQRGLVDEAQLTKISEIAKNLYAKVPESDVLQDRVSSAAKKALNRAQEVYHQMPVEQAKGYLQSALDTLKKRATDVYVGLPLTQARDYLDNVVKSATGESSQVMYERVRIKSGSLLQQASEKLRGVKTYAFKEITPERAAALLEQVKQSGAAQKARTIYERVPVDQATEYVKNQYSQFKAEKLPVFVRIANDALAKAQPYANEAMAKAQPYASAAIARAQPYANQLKDTAVGLYTESNLESLKTSVTSKVLSLWNQVPSLSSLASHLPQIPKYPSSLPSTPEIPEGNEEEEN